MGTSKSEQFSEKQNRLANYTKALGHPARIAVIEHLLENGACNCGDIVSALPLAQPTVSQHLKELKEAGLLKATTHGNAVTYAINEKVFGKLEKKMLTLFKKVRKKV